ncbi:MAG TPA: ATP-binding cassette domain-containing protein [Methylomusa anaerophila]|uniref:Putative ABC transporter ATP-binding protein YbhF n=1 Tax=Methylomusa anaerophila TaxID=1930071 RepID=A0A348AF28_9FIRM|nr:ATP-binding cassette domain-containing protein [Methylomusa anaerophila]BBB89676.1 putative ABC transporter ATP-binding protein YbhF [Methylomusa anaerophila]HML89547.1 ATP-binding cassette domain-containing protein [Methylomusa anaerophila]
MITVEGLCKTFKVAKRSAGFKAALRSLFRREYIAIEALRDVSFHINEGEIVGYIGPNGAGKSTTIKVMSGILVPDKGKCSILGRTPWKERIAHVTNIGVVFGQRSQLWWDVPVIDSFELLRDIYEVEKEKYRNNLDMLVETLGLSSILNNPVRQLSLGQRMRCEIAASLLHSPKILFLDEPTIGLDAVSKIAVRQFIKSINKEKKVTVILTTHDLGDIEALADRILLIGKGRILYDGSLNSLRSQFGACKTITIDFRENSPPPAIKGTEMLVWSPERATLLVDTHQAGVSRVIATLAEQLELLDVTVENPPIEEIIVQLYKEYEI